MWCTQRVIQEVALPQPAADQAEADPLPSIGVGQSVPGTRVVSQGAERPSMSCPTGSAPSVVGNDSFRGVLVWECVKTWQEYVPPATDSPTVGPDEEAGGVDLVSVLGEVDVRRGPGQVRPVSLSSAQQQARVTAAAGVMSAIVDGDLGEAAKSAQELSDTYAQAIVSTLPPRQARQVARQLERANPLSRQAKQVQARVGTLVATDVNRALAAVNVARPTEVARALAQPRVQSVLGSDLTPEVSRVAQLSMAAGNLPAVAGVLRTEERVPATEYRIAEALSRGNISQARQLASGMTDFKSSIVSLALRELLVSQGQASPSAQVAAAQALIDGTFRPGAWYAFQGEIPQPCSSPGCVWLVSSSN